MERLKEAFHIALANLTTHLVRSLLSLLGIVIGIASVIAIVALGDGMREQIIKRVEAMGGSTLFYISATYDEASGRMGQMDIDDLERLQKLPFVLTAYPQLNLYQEIRSRFGSNRGLIRGIGENYLQARQARLTEGRPLSPAEIDARARLCLINQPARAILFPGSDALGQSVYIEGSPWEIIGVYKESTRASYRGKDIEVLVPLSTLLRNMNRLDFQTIEVQTKPEAGAALSRELMDTIIRGDARREKLFSVRDQREFAAQSLQIQKILSMIGTVVAGISLLVGGIGMMNVMLTTVAERTREIGIRRAIGARQKDILFQFLVESCALSGMGGLIGMIVGTAIAKILPLLFKQMMIEPRIGPTLVVVAVGGGMVMGAIFGFYPAIKASRLSPAESLRSE